MTPQARTAGVLLALVASIAAIYWPGLHGGFVFDDFPNIVNNAALHVGSDDDWRLWLAAAFSSPSSDLQRPLAMLTFALNFAAAGMDPFAMKATNLAIHTINALLVFALVRRLVRLAGQNAHAERTMAAWIAATWALHPLNLMAVLLVVQRMESLCHTFVFAGLWLYLVGRERIAQAKDERGWLLLLAGLVGGTTLGALTKESAVLLPLYALLVEWALLDFATADRPRDPRLLILFGVVLVLPAIAGVLWLLPGLWSGYAYAGRDFTLAERLLTEGRVVFDYLRWALLPDLSQLSLYHDDYPLSRSLMAPPATALALLALAGLASLAIGVRRRRPLLALGIAWFFAAHALTATLIPLELVYEHRNYFALFGVCVALADLLLAPQPSNIRQAGVAAAALLLMFFTTTTALRVREWRTPLQFASTEASKHPQSPRATYALARELVIISSQSHNPADADRAFEALEHAMAVPGATPMPEAAAIVLASRTGRKVESRWWLSLRNKLRTHAVGPQQDSALASLVDCQIQQRCDLPPQEMRGSFAAALHRSRKPETLSIYGNYVLNVLVLPNEALYLWLEAAHRAPNVPQYQISVARLLIASGRPDLARPYIDNLRQSGRLGQNEAAARSLERLAATTHGQLPGKP